MGLFLSFKFYRLAWSFIFGKPGFYARFQKKRFKKATLAQTVIAMFFVEVPIIVCDVVAMG
jgi:hypothetical protein